jgi:hypothetical protein
MNKADEIFNRVNNQIYTLQYVIEDLPTQFILFTDKKEDQPRKETDLTNN